MNVNQKDKSSRRVSVLGEAPTAKPPKGGKTKLVAWLALVLWLLIAVMSDLSVFLLSIPEFDQLQVYEGTITFTKGGKRNTYLAMNTGDKVIDFTCWISSTEISDCIRHEQWPLYRGKHGKIYSYRAMINGFLYENRLLQFEVDNETVIPYSDKKEEYLESQRGYPYIHSLLTIPILIWIALLYLSNNYREEKKIQK